VLAQQAGWRDELKKTIAQAVQEGHLRADTDAAQLAFEGQALMLALHHDGGPFGHGEAGRHAAAALERLGRRGQPGTRPSGPSMSALPASARLRLGALRTGLVLSAWLAPGHAADWAARVFATPSSRTRAVPEDGTARHGRIEVLGESV